MDPGPPRGESGLSQGSQRVTPNRPRRVLRLARKESRDNNLSDTRIRYENNGVEGAWSIAGKIGQHTANEADFEIAFDDYWDLNIVVRMGGVEIKRFGVRDQSDDDNNVN